MHHYRIIFLLLSSLFFSSCAYHKLNSCQKNSLYGKQKGIADSTVLINPFIYFDKAIKYKASIDVLNKHFTGIIVIKQTDPQTKHLVFLTELGMRMFDFEWKGDSMKPVFIFDPLNKPKLIKALTRNFETIFYVKWVNPNLKYIGNCHEFYNIVYLGVGKKSMFLFDRLKPDIGEQIVFNKRKKESKTIYSSKGEKIKLKQYGLVKFYIELDKINE
jgi:hypothetical protein